MCRRRYLGPGECGTCEGEGVVRLAWDSGTYVELSLYDEPWLGGLERAACSECGGRGCHADTIPVEPWFEGEGQDHSGALGLGFVKGKDHDQSQV